MIKLLPLTSTLILSSALYVLLGYNNVVKPLPLESTPWILGGIFVVFLTEARVQNI